MPRFNPIGFEQQEGDPDVIISPWACKDAEFDAFFGLDLETCFRPHCTNSAAKKCAKCCHARYCRKKCQTADWKKHKTTCQNPVAGSILVGRVPSSWLRSAPTGNASSVQSARLVYDETGSGKSVDYPEIRSAAQNAGLVGFLEHHQDNTEGLYSIVLADGDGTFISPVTPPPSPIAQCGGFKPDFVTGLLQFHPRGT
jgi:hypothetical protein